MRGRIVICGLVAAFTSIGCSNTSEPEVLDLTCTITFSGALTTTHDCGTRVSAIYTASNDSTVVSGGVQGTPALATYLRFKGTPTTGTFKHSDTGARGFVSASSGSNGWIATTTGMIGSPPVSGSWTLVLTSVTEIASTSGSVTYHLAGTIDATMPSASGGGTTLMAHIVF